MADGVTSLGLPIFTGMPDAQDVNGVVLNFVAHLIVADEDATHLAWFEFFQALADPRVATQA